VKFYSAVLCEGLGLGLEFFKKVLTTTLVESVPNGRNYVRSLKGLQLLKEALSRLQWDEFFPKDSKMDKYRVQLETIIQLRNLIFRKVKEESRRRLKISRAAVAL